MPPTASEGSPANVPAPQPVPLSTRVSRIETDTGPATAIARLFPADELAHCHLCPSCSASPSGHCLIVARRHVPDDEAPLYRFRGPAG